MFPFRDTTFTWKSVEKQNAVLKQRFINASSALLKNERDFYSNEFEPITKFYGAIHILDINNDGLDDVIYAGSTGGEGNEVVVFLNTKDGFKKVFRGLQYVRKLEFKDGKLFRLYILDDGCCAEWIDFNRILQLEYQDGVPKFNTIYLTSNTSGAYFPKVYFDKPVSFEVLNNEYKMRDSAGIDDTTKSGMGGIPFKGNNIDTLMKGTKGRAIAAQTDKTGRVWWLVEIDNHYRDYGYLFYEQSGDTTERASHMGWISSRYVKKLDN